MIEPLEIVPAKIILNIYRQCIKSNNFNLNDIRGIPKIEYVWDETACGSKLVIGDNGKVIRVPKGLGSWRSFRAKMVLEYSYIYEWDVIIEKASWVGVASENLNYEDFAGNQPNGWVLGSCGGCYNSGYYKNDYCLSFGDGLQHLLSHTHEKKKIFATPEYEVFRYSTILVAKQVSYEAFKTFLKRLPTLDQLENSIQVENKFITDHQKVVKELEPLIKFIDFRRIKGQILVDIIEPLEIVQAKIILDVYRYYTKSNNSNLNDIRGIPKIEYVWDETACGSKLIIEDNGKVVYAPNGLNSWRSVRAKNKLEYEGIYEWDFIIKNLCFAAVGVCASENLNYEAYPGYQFAGWIIDYNGCCYSFGNCIHNYCPRFGDGAKITVHLDANEKTCAFTVNGTKTPKLSACNNLTSKFYPLVSLYNSGRIQIQSHSKEIEIF
ncbi:hypothetical protein GLOIN_2v1472107 [Rhizophagus irregularis DAOM 181602=DAOM 197198]|nr:hypothetical protein GLOIN_2v1472107 [Rhizophagus irregularis DAOM 181602=DAOM 197198]